MKKYFPSLVKRCLAIQIYDQHTFQKKISIIFPPKCAVKTRNKKSDISTDISSKYWISDIGQYRHDFTNQKCDVPKPEGPVTTRQPIENFCVSYYETHT